MQRLAFSKWDPSGNLTVFLPASLPPELAGRRAGIARFAMGQGVLHAEQAGFADIGRSAMQMAGGEFCVNATRSFGALLALARAREEGRGHAPLDMAFEVSVSGWPCPVQVAVRGACPDFEVEARLGFGGAAMEEGPGGAVTVHLPGISHRLMPQASHPLPGNLLSSALSLLHEQRLDSREACGAVWWREEGEELAILPVVYVSGAGTIVAEQACGSATLSLALALAAARGQRRFAVRQPSGDVLDVILEQDAGGRTGAPGGTGTTWATVGGRVRLVCEGELYLPDGF